MSREGDNGRLKRGGMLKRRFYDVGCKLRGGKER